MMNIYGIRFKILIFSLTISFLPIVCLSYLAFYNAKVSTEAMITSHLVSIADLKKREIIAWVNEKIEETLILSNYPDLQSFISRPSQLKMTNYLREMAELNKWENVSVVTRDGDVIATNKNGYQSNRIKSFVGTLLVKGEVVISDYYLSKGNTPTISLITPLAQQGKVSQTNSVYLIIEVNLDAEILPLINNWPGMGHTGETLIAKQIDDDIIFINKLRHRQETQQHLKIPKTSKNALPAIFASSGNEGVIRTTDYRGEEVLAVYRFIPQLNWGFVAKIDQKEAFAPIKTLQQNAIIATIMILAFVSIVSVMISNSIVQPLSYLEQMAKKFSRGDLSAKINLNATGEIGSLARTLEKMKNDLASLQQETLRNEKLAAIGKLSGSVAHDIRNPLGSISNSIFFLNMVSENSQDAQLKKHLGLMQTEISRVNTIIDDLMDFSRENKPNLILNDLNELLTKVVKETDNLNNIICNMELDEDLPLFMFDEVQMQRVFINLINNSVQAMVDGGELHIVTQLNENKIQVQIADNGSGISENELIHIFEPLFTTKSKGVGLGLSITKTFIEKHNGQIEVQSQPTQGTTFFITLPYIT